MVFVTHFSHHMCILRINDGIVELFDMTSVSCMVIDPVNADGKSDFWPLSHTYPTMDQLSEALLSVLKHFG